MTDFSNVHDLFGAEQHQTRVNYLLSESMRMYEDEKGGMMIRLPLRLPDGKELNIQVATLDAAGGEAVRLSDKGATLAAIGYDSGGATAFVRGRAWSMLHDILIDGHIHLVGGELITNSHVSNIGQSLFRFTQAVSKICYLPGLFDNFCQELTFYDELPKVLARHVKQGKLIERYQLTGLQHGECYTVDYCIEMLPRPLFVFGIADVDKARLSTMTMQYLQSQNVDCGLLLVVSPSIEIPLHDFKRLCYAAGDGSVISMQGDALENHLNGLFADTPQTADQEDKS